MPRSKPECFARRLRKLRQAAGLNQSELAARAGLTPQALSLLEAGRRQPTWGTVQALAAALGATPNDFLRSIPS